jgi:hypothetical protein
VGEHYKNFHSVLIFFSKDKRKLFLLASVAVSIAYKLDVDTFVRKEVFIRNARANMRRPLSFTKRTYSHGEPNVEAMCMRRIFLNPGRTLLFSLKTNAVPGSITRSSQPFSCAGNPPHHVG